MSLSADSLEMQYLSDKRVQLSAAGTKLNDLYYSTLNSTVEAVECTFFAGKFRQNLPSTTFGSLSQILIPNGSFIGSVWLHLEFSGVDLPGPNVSLARGWGYSCIQQVSFLLGSSNTSTLTLTGESLWHAVCAQCETAEKRSELFRLAGQSNYSSLVGSGQRFSADVFIPLPFSEAGGHNKKPFDSQLLDNPITVQIQFKPASAIFGGTGTPPTKFTQAQLSCRQGDLTNKDVSIKLKLLNTVGTYISYPFIYFQAQPPVAFAGRTGGINNRATVQLNSFINGDLVGLIVSVLRRDFVSPGYGGSRLNSTPNPMIFDDISEVELRLNGQTVYYAPDHQNRLISADTIKGAAYYMADVAGDETAQPFSSKAKDVYPLIVDFSRIRSMVIHDQMPNVFRIPTQPMQLLFNTEIDNITYDLYSTYCYTAIDALSIGTSTIYYD